MSESLKKLTAPPIVEAIVDINCDMPANFDLASLESLAGKVFEDKYPKRQTKFLEEHRFEPHPEEPTKHLAKRRIEAFQFFHGDGKQLIQVRSQGYSFNRLSPYTSLDDYLNEIKRTWDLFVSFTHPVQVRAIKLRYVNRILLPLENGKVDLKKFLRNSPELPAKSGLEFIGFLNQYTAIEIATENQATIILTTQLPEDNKLPLIFDNGAYSLKKGNVDDWGWILKNILSLRSLKNRVFENTLTEECLKIFCPIT